MPYKIEKRSAGIRFVSNKLADKLMQSCDFRRCGSDDIPDCLGKQLGIYRGIRIIVDKNYRYNVEASIKKMKTILGRVDNSKKSIFERMLSCLIG